MMHTAAALGLIFVVMVSDVVARPEPLPMFLVNRAIKAAEFDVKKVDQDVPITPTPGTGSADMVPTLESLNGNFKTNNDENSPVEKSQTFNVKDHIENVPVAVDLASSLLVESKLNDPVGSEVSIDQTEVNSTIENRSTNEEQKSNNEITSTVAGSGTSEDDNDQTASATKKLAVKKAPRQKKPLKSRKMNNVVSLNRMRLLDSLIDFLLDSLIPTNDDFRRDLRTRTFDEYFDYAFPPPPYNFHYF